MVKKKNNTVIKCHKCKKKIIELPFKCGYCDEFHCSDHRLPESHNCKYLEGKNKRNLNDWKDTLVNIDKNYQQDIDKPNDILNVKLFNSNKFFKKKKSQDIEIYDNVLLEELESTNYDTSDIESESDWSSVSIVSFIFIIGLSLFLAFGSTGESEYSYLSNYVYGGYDATSMDELPITYSISESCGSSQYGRINNAFNILSEESGYVVFFTYVNSNPDIDIKCHLEAVEEDGYYTSGLATLGTIGYSVSGSEIDFYNVNPISNNRFPGGCLTYPNTELHEILHTFGFDHNESRNSIMNSVSSGCVVRSIDNYIIRSLQDTYS